MNIQARLRDAEADNGWVDVLVGANHLVSGYVGQMLDGEQGLVVALASCRRGHEGLIPLTVVGVPVSSIRALHVRHELGAS